MEPDLLQKIMAEADLTARLEDLQIYLNWIITKSHRYAISTFFRGMPGLTDSCNMNTWLGDCLGRPVGEVIRELLASMETLRLAAGMSCLSSALPVPAGCFEGNAIDYFEKLRARTELASSDTLPREPFGVKTDIRWTSLSYFHAPATFTGTTLMKFWRRQKLC